MPRKLIALFGLVALVALVALSACGGAAPADANSQFAGSLDVGQDRAVRCRR